MLAGAFVAHVARVECAGRLEQHDLRFAFGDRAESAKALLKKEELQQHLEAQKRCQGALALDNDNASARSCLKQIEEWKVDRTGRDLAEARSLAASLKYADAGAYFADHSQFAGQIRRTHGESVAS